MFPPFSHHQVLTRFYIYLQLICCSSLQWPMFLFGNNFFLIFVYLCNVLCILFVKTDIIKDIKMLMLRCQIVTYFQLCVVCWCWIMWFLFCILLVIVGFGPSFFCVILCWYFVFFVLCSTVICGNVMFLCSLLYCVIGRCSCYFACSCRYNLIM
jgi:hypothetical protein